MVVSSDPKLLQQTSGAQPLAGPKKTRQGATTLTQRSTYSQTSSEAKEGREGEEGKGKGASKQTTRRGEKEDKEREEPRQI